MSSLSTSIYGSSANKGVGGLMSGLDTDELVNQMLATTRNRINKQYQAKQKLLYKQEAYREITSKLLAFSNKYFSYSSGSKTNILSPKFFESYTYKPSSNYVNVTGNAENIKNFQITEISSVASAASMTSTKSASTKEFSSAEMIDRKYISSLAGDTMSINYDSKNYNITFSSTFGIGNDQISLEDVRDELNTQINKIDDLKGKVSYEVVNNELQIKSTEEDKEIKLIAASHDIEEFLKFSVQDGSASSADKIVGDDLSKLSKGAKEVILDGSITFDFNGVQKTIKFSEMEEDSSYTNYDAKDIKDFLQKKLNKEYGSGKITVDVSTDGKDTLTFKTKEGTETDIFSVRSISSELSNFTGIKSGSSNRINQTAAIEKSGIAGLAPIKEGEKYSITINDKTLTFEKTASLNDIIKAINNDADMKVTVSYSSTTDKFSIKADETGGHTKIDIENAEEGSLAYALFGAGNLNDYLEDGEFYEYDETSGTYNILKYDEITKENKIIGKGTLSFNDDTKKYQFKLEYEDPLKNKTIENIDYAINNGTDTKMSYTLNGVPTTVTRSTANFTIDDINIELNKNAEGLKSTDTPITFDVTNNSDEVVARVKEFIDQYNEIITLIGTKTKEKPSKNYAPLTPEQRDEMEKDEIENWDAEAKKGILFSDNNMNNVMRDLRFAMTGPTSVSSLILADIGISAAYMDTSGKLVLDEEKLKERLLENPDEIASLFTGTTTDTSSYAKSGIAIQIQEILKKNIGVFGTSGILIEEAGLDNNSRSDQNNISLKIKQYDDKMEQLKKDMEKERERYWKKFTALERTLSNLNAQSQWLTDSMG